MPTTDVLPPGPRLPGVVQAVLWGLRYPEFTQRAHRRFGDTFTVRAGTMPATVLTTDRDAVRRLLTGTPLTKRHANDVTRPLLDDASVMLLEPAEHLARRKLLLPPFHGERIRSYAELMQRLMDEAVDGWRPGETVGTLAAAQDITIEVILQAVLGVRDPGTRDRFRRLIDDLLFYPLGHARLRVSRRLATRVRLPRRVRAAAAFAGSLPTPAVLTYFPEMKERGNLMTRAWWRHHDRLMSLFDEQIAATRSDPGLAEREDILAMLVQARDEDGGGLSGDALRNDLLTLIGAGHETTAATIAWGAVLLAHHPDVRDRAAAAARAEDDAYLGALVKEVLRLRPPLPIASGRRVTEPFAIGDHTIPPDTIIVVDQWGLHHDPELYPEPEAFRPERFLDGAPDGYAFLPFGGGAHRCLGAGLAELEAKIALGTMLRRIDIEPADAELAPVARRGIVMVPHGGGRIRVGAVHR